MNSFIYSHHYTPLPSYADIASRYRPPSDPQLRSAHDALLPVITRALSSFGEMKAFLDRSCTEAIDSIKQKQLVTIPPREEEDPSIYTWRRIARSMNCAALEISKLFPYPLHLPSNSLIIDNYYTPSGYLLPHHNEKHRRGCCHGMSTWFVILYLKTKHLFPHPTEQLLWLAQQGETGAKLPQILLQCLNYTGEKLGLKIGIQQLNDPTRKPLHFLHFHDEITLTLVEKLNEIEPGVYLIKNNSHQCAYVNINKTLGYFFDPNTGVIQIKGPQAILYLPIRKAMSFESLTAQEEKELKKLIDKICLHRETLIDEPETATESFSIENNPELKKITLDICEQARAIIEKYIKSHGNKFAHLLHVFETWKYCCHFLNELSVDKTRIDQLLSVLNDANRLLMAISDYSVEIFPVELIQAHSDSTSTESFSPNLDPI